MPDRTACVNCKKVGFVRREQVVRGGQSTTQFYCGSCDYTWTTAEPKHSGSHSRGGKGRG